MSYSMSEESEDEATLSDASDEKSFELLKVIIYEPSKEPRSISKDIPPRHYPFLYHGIILNVDGTYCEDYDSYIECGYRSDDDNVTRFKRKHLHYKTQRMLDSLQPKELEDRTWQNEDNMYRGFTDDEEGSDCFSEDHLPSYSRRLLPGEHLPANNRECFSGDNLPANTGQCSSGDNLLVNTAERSSGDNLPANTDKCSSGDNLPANTLKFLNSLDSVPVKKQKKIERFKKVKKIKQNTKFRNKLKKLRKKRNNMVVRDSQFNDDFIALPSTNEPSRFDNQEVFTNINSNQDIQPRRENRYFKKFDSNPNPQAKKPRANIEPAGSNEKRYRKDRHFTRSLANSLPHLEFKGKKLPDYITNPWKKKKNNPLNSNLSPAPNKGKLPDYILNPWKNKPPNSNSSPSPNPGKLPDYILDPWKNNNNPPDSNSSPSPNPNKFPAFIRNSWKKHNNRPKNVPNMNNTSVNNGSDYIPFSNYRNNQPRFPKNRYIPPPTNSRYFNLNNC